ncbi:CHAT domain-containing protein [Mycena rosella]|uniref:CHAT domain-containing protein n=1 Tax=Mycena rosella TaxID=1033263 RepID=A0AAD7GQ73_MYCRO|nr:CHAT domain-containing protein [Mycena rosella]
MSLQTTDTTTPQPSDTEPPSDAEVGWVDRSSGYSSDVDEGIERHRAALALHPPSDPTHTIDLNNLAVAVQTRFDQRGDPQDLDEAIEIHRRVIAALPLQHPHRSVGLNNLGWALETRFKLRGDPKDLDEGIECHTEAVARQPPAHPNRDSSLSHLARATQTRFEERGNKQDIDHAIELQRQVLALCQPDPSRTMVLDNLGWTLETRFEKLGDTNDLDEAIMLCREAMAQDTHPHRDGGLTHLAQMVQIRFDQRQDAKDLDEVIALQRQVLTLRPTPDKSRVSCLDALANFLKRRFNLQGDRQDLEESIDLHREALDARRAASDLDRSMSLNDLGEAIRTRFFHWGDGKDLDEVIRIHSHALALRGPLHPHRSTSLNNLGLAILARFQHRGDIRDLEDSIAIYREALALRAPSDPDRSMALNNLGDALQTRFDRQGNPKDLDETIGFYREGLALRPPPHLHRDNSLNNLAAAMVARFRERGDPKDLREAIDLHREALKLHPPPHPTRSISLSNLAAALKVRFHNQGDSRDLDEVIELEREAIMLRGPSDPHRDTALNNLAMSLRARFDQAGDAKDLDESVDLHREALARRPLPHPKRDISLSTLAGTLQTRFEQRGDSKDLHEAIELSREGVALCPPPHAGRGTCLMSLAVCLAELSSYIQDAHASNDAFALFQEASAYSSSSPLTRFHHTIAWAATATSHDHPSSLAAYSEAINLLPQLAALHLNLASRRQMLSNPFSTSLASRAATCAVRLDQYKIAVEFMEASRSVFWSQALHLRTPLNELESIRPDFARRLRELSVQLEQAGFRETKHLSADTDQFKILTMEAEGSRYRDLNQEWVTTITSVRTLPGFEDFMQPNRMAKLREAALQGPIVILHCGRDSSNALVVTPLDVVECVPLPELPLPVVQVLAHIIRLVSNSTSVTVEDLIKNDQRSKESVITRLFAERESSDGVDANEIFGSILALLWNVMVLPVFEALHLKKSYNPPRLWWCPTGPFAFLPIHAAGIYAEDGTNCVADYVVSSYTPTITALLDPPSNAAPSFKMTAVVQTSYTDHPALPGAQRELKMIMDRVPNEWLTTLDDPVTVQNALGHLLESSIVHFACHGAQELKQPLDSGLILSDGRLRVSEIMRRPEGDDNLNVKHSMSLAFLSACETAKGDRTMPDEAMHLAATLLFAGFRGVVATMWAMNDGDGPMIADTFYKHLFEQCDPNSNPPVLPDLTRAAEALHIAVAKLREEPTISFKRWVPFVHYGL